MQSEVVGRGWFFVFPKFTPSTTGTGPGFTPATAEPAKSFGEEMTFKLHEEWKK